MKPLATLFIFVLVMLGCAGAAKSKSQLNVVEVVDLLPVTFERILPVAPDADVHLKV